MTNDLKMGLTAGILIGGVIMAVGLLLLMPTNPCPPCLEAVTINDSFPVTWVIVDTPMDTLNARAAATHDSVLPTVTAKVVWVFEKGDYVETVEGHRGYVQWTGTEPGLYGVKLTEYPLMFEGCFNETMVIRGEYLKLVEEL